MPLHVNGVDQNIKQKQQMDAARNLYESLMVHTEIQESSLEKTPSSLKT